MRSLSVPGTVGHGHDQPLGPACQVHGPADPKQWLAGHGPVGQIGLFIHLQAAHDSHIHMAAPNHGKRVAAVEITAARQGCDRFFAGVDRVLQGSPALGGRPDPQHAVFRMQDNAMVCADEVRDKGRDADAQVDNIPWPQLC